MPTILIAPPQLRKGRLARSMCESVCYSGRTMRLLQFVALIFTVSAHAFGQMPAPAPAPTPTPVPFPTDPRALLAAAAPFYDFNSPDLKPWHLKATYQFYDDKGAPAEQGTFEYWWASPKVHKSAWVQPGSTRTDWATSDGAVYRSQTGQPLRYFPRTVEGMLFTPLPGREASDPQRYRLDLKTMPYGGMRMACALLTRLTELDRKPREASGAAPEFCFDPQTSSLRAAWNASISSESHHISTVQGRYLPREIDVLFGKQRIFSIKVEAIDAFAPSDAVLKPAAEAVPAHITIAQTAFDEGGADPLKGSAISKVPPVYPPAAKIAGQTGVVVVGVHIGPDGMVQAAEVLGTQGQLLSQAALAAVKQWQYRPLLIDGKPAEAEMLINCYFSLAGHF